MTRLALLAVVLSAGCEVYDSSLLVAGEGGPADGGMEACSAMCGTLCVDLQNDQSNCGTCNHACETGCAQGLCKPTVLTTGLGAPHGIVVSGPSLYVANNGSINVDVMSKVDGTGLKEFANAAGGVLQPDRVATDGTNLYWTDDANLPASSNGAVYFGALDGSFCNAMNMASYCYDVHNLPSPYAIAVQGSTIFFTTRDATNMSANGCPTNAWTSSVLACPLTGCATTACAASGGPTVLASNQTQLAGVTADATNVYWADFGGKEVRFCPQPGCGAPKTFASNLGGPYDVISDGATVYFSDRTGGALYACPIAGCGQTPKALATGLTDPFLLAQDGMTLYATLYNKGQVVACKLPDCAGGPTVIAANLHAPYGITTDATYVYWSEEGTSGPASTDGTVSKLRKD